MSRIVALTVATILAGSVSAALAAGTMSHFYGANGRPASATSAAIPFNGKEAATPCTSGMELLVAVRSLDGVAATEIGFTLSLMPNGTGGVISRLHTGQSFMFAAQSCQRWQRELWPYLSQALSARRRPASRPEACTSLALVQYQIGRQGGSEQLCLTSARTDAVTGLFRRFYEGTDFMVHP